MTLFKKLDGKATKMFSKLGHEAASFGRKISRGASDGLRTVSSGIGGFAESKIGQGILGNIRAGQVATAGKLLGDLGNTVDYRNYRGGPQNVFNQIEKNAKKLTGDVRTEIFG